MTEHRCIVCPQLRNGEPRVYDRPNVCDGCRSRLRSMLGELVELYALLPSALEPGSAHGGPKVSGSPSRSLGVRLDPLSLLSPAGPAMAVADPYGDQYGPLPPLVVLDQWIGDWVDVRALAEHAPPATMTDFTRWLADRLDWACDLHPAVDDFARELSDLTGIVASAAHTDRGRGEKVGRCPAVLRDDSRCDYQLRVDPYVDQIQCGRCGTRWDRRRGEWLQLRAAQLEGGSSGAARER